MIKLVNLIVPKKEYITKKRDLICSTLSISILLLVILNIYFFKKLNCSRWTTDFFLKKIIKRGKKRQRKI